MIGRKLAQYKVLEEIGRGGMGVVYRALDTSLQREVALKVLGAASGADARARATSSQRGPRCRAPRSPGDLRGVRDRRGRRRRLHRHGAGSRPPAGRVPGRRASRARPSAGSGHRGRRGPHRGPCPRRRSPRSQAEERHAHGLRPRQDHRLRPGQAHWPSLARRQRQRHPVLGRHRSGSHRGHRGLHVAGTGPGRRRRGREQRTSFPSAPSCTRCFGGSPPSGGRPASRPCTPFSRSRPPVSLEAPSAPRPRSFNGSSICVSPRRPRTAMAPRPRSWATCSRPGVASMLGPPSRNGSRLHRPPPPIRRPGPWRSRGASAS